MSDIHFDCPHCQTHIVSDESVRGQRVTCPTCERSIVAMPKQNAPAPAASAFPNTVHSDLEIKGTLRCKKPLQFNGKITGEIFANASIHVGANGYIQGDIHAASVVVQGSVKGNIIAKERCELKSNSEFIGHLKAPRLAMEEGSIFSGRSEITPNQVDMPKHDSSAHSSPQNPHSATA